MKNNEPSKLKDLDNLIRKQITTAFYGMPLRARQMRDRTWEENEGYRDLVDAAAPILQLEGEITHWNRIQNERRRGSEGADEQQQFQLSDLPDAPPEFSSLKRRSYIPADESEVSETEDGSHLEPENMTWEQHGAASKFYAKQSAASAMRAEGHRKVQLYYDAMGIPHEMTLAEWRDSGLYPKSAA